MTQQDIEASEAPLIEHLIELRTRLIYCVVGFIGAFILSFFFSSDILNLLVLPFKWGTGQDVSLISIKLLGVFLVKLKIAFFGGLFIGFPLIATQVYRFVAPGLYSHEKQAFLPYLVATPVFFILGASLVYFFLLPVAIHFFTALAGTSGVTLMPDIEAYLGFVLSMFIAFGAAFEVPVVLVVLARMKVVTVEQLKAFRAYFIVVAFVIAAIVTPPDVISQLALAIPMCLLYEVGIWAARIFIKHTQAPDAAPEETTS